MTKIMLCLSHHTETGVMVTPAYLVYPCSFHARTRLSQFAMIAKFDAVVVVPSSLPCASDYSWNSNRTAELQGIMLAKPSDQNIKGSAHETEKIVRLA